MSIRVSTSEITISDPAVVQQRAQKFERDLRRFGRQDWSFWATTVVVILSLTAALGTFATWMTAIPNDPFYQFHMSQSVSGLMGLVLLFSLYTLYQQFQLRRTRHELIAQIEVAAHEQIRAEEFLKLAMLDPLTGLHNRRHVQERLATDISRAQRYKSPLTVLMMDLDNFKELNDQYGHAMGDSALKIFADRLSTAIRGSDMAARIGGDEFVVLLPECKLGQVQSVLQRLTPLKVDFSGEQVPFVFSAGWTEYRAGETADQLLQRADHALYAEKQKRKSQPQRMRVPQPVAGD